MTINLFIQCFLIGLLGIAFQTMMKIKVLSDKARAANTHFQFKDYFIQDYPTVILNFIVLTACIFASDEILNFKPILLNYIKGFYFFIGFTGSAILNMVLSNVNKRIMKIIDEKTNTADEIFPNGNSETIPFHKGDSAK